MMTISFSEESRKSKLADGVWIANCLRFEGREFNLEEIDEIQPEPVSEQIFPVSRWQWAWIV